MLNLSDPNAITIISTDVVASGRKRIEYRIRIDLQLDGYPLELMLMFYGIPDVPPAKLRMVDAQMYTLLPRVSIHADGTIEHERGEPSAWQVLEFVLLTDAPDCHALAAAARGGMQPADTIAAVRAVLAEHFQERESSASSPLRRVFRIVRDIMLVQGFEGMVRVLPNAAGYFVELVDADPMPGGRHIPYDMRVSLVNGVKSALALFDFQGGRVLSRGGGVLRRSVPKEHTVKVPPDPSGHLGIAASNRLAAEAKRTPELAELIAYAQKTGDEFRALTGRR